MLLIGCVLPPTSAANRTDAIASRAISSAYAIRQPSSRATLLKSASSHTDRAPGTNHLRYHLQRYRKSGRRWQSQYLRRRLLHQSQVQRLLRNRQYRTASRVCSPTAATTRTRILHPTPMGPKRQMRQSSRSRLPSGYAAAIRMRWRTIQTLPTSLRKCRSPLCSASWA